MIDLLARLKNVRKTATGWTACCPAHEDERSSLSVAKPNGRWLLHCFAGCDINEICRALDIDVTALSEPKHKLVKTYDYVNEAGALLFQVCRYEPKKFSQRRPDGGGGWIWKLGEVRRVLYRLPELIEAVSLGRTVLIVEGEKDVDALSAIRLSATCNSGGAGKWHDDAAYNEPLRDADVVLVPDNDNTGWEHINKVGAILSGITARTRVLMLPGLAAKGDISDWLAAGGTREQLDSLVEDAPIWVAPARAKASGADKAEATAGEDALLEELARLNRADYDRRRKEAAAQLGIRRSTLDAQVEARRAQDHSAPALYGFWVVEPWPEPVEGDSLLRDVICRVRRHAAISHNQALAIALWVMLSWVHDSVAVHSPMLLVTSAEPNSGKTTLLGVLTYLIPRALLSIQMSEAALFRSIELWQPSFAVDEADTALVDNEPLRAVINSGHTRGACVIRCVGDVHKIPHAFQTFAPKILGMKGRRLPDTTISRCIIIEMRRRRADELVDPFRHCDDPELGDLRRRLLRWSSDNGDTLRDTMPRTAMPPEFENRLANNWQLQFAIADLCGEDWGSQARDAAAVLEGASDTTTRGVRLLADIKRIFDEGGCDSILSATLVEKLKEDQEGPWLEFRRGKALTQNGLARLLGGFCIHSQNVRPSPQVQGRGYHRHQFEDAWSRYLSSSPPKGL